MIYLIEGPPRCGKTTLARQLAKRLGISYLSVDSLESVIRYHLPSFNMDHNFFDQIEQITTMLMVRGVATVTKR